MYNDKQCFLTEEQLTALAVAAVIGIGFVGIAAAHRDTTESELPLSARNIIEDLDGKEATMTVVEMTLEPVQAGTPRDPPGPLFGYVLEGEYELAMDDQRTKVIQVGETFYESTGRLHGVLTNPAGKSKTRILAVVLNPRESRQVAIQDPKPVERRFGLHTPDRHIIPRYQGLATVLPNWCPPAPLRNMRPEMWDSPRGRESNAALR